MTESGKCRNPYDRFRYYNEEVPPPSLVIYIAHQMRVQWPVTRIQQEIRRKRKSLNPYVVIKDLAKTVIEFGSTEGTSHEIADLPKTAVLYGLTEYVVGELSELQNLGGNGLYSPRSIMENFAVEVFANSHKLSRREDRLLFEARIREKLREHNSRTTK